jgi:hypothetical protein
MAGTYHLANLHDNSYRTWTIPTPKIDDIPDGTSQELTFEIWQQLRQQVFNSMKYYPCLTGVSLEYVLNYLGARYNRDETTVIYTKDKHDNPIKLADGSYAHLLKVKEDKFNARMHKRAKDGKLPYSSGQHIALYTNEEALEPLKVMPQVPPRNMIFTFINASGDCKAIMLGVHSDENTKNDVRDEDTGEIYEYDKLYEGIYVDALCGAGSGGAGTNFFKILRNLYPQINFTLKATIDATSFYPTLKLNPGFTFGTCEKKQKQNDSDEIVRLLSSLPIAERTPFFAKYELLTKDQKNAVKLLFQHNLADDQNNALGRWKTRLNAKGGEMQEECSFFADESDAIDDKAAARLYRNQCLDNGVKMSSCTTKKKKKLKIVAYAASDTAKMEKKLESIAREARRQFGSTVTKKIVSARLSDKVQADTMWDAFQKYNLLDSPEKKSSTKKKKSHKKKA